MKRILNAINACFFSLVPLTAFADGFFVAHVTSIDPTRVGYTTGAAIYFQVDAAITSTCPLGTWLFYAAPTFGENPPILDKQLANTKAVLSTLQLAHALGKQVNMYVYTTNQAQGFCQVIYVNIQP